LTVGVLIFATLAWWRSMWSLPARLHYTTLTVAAIAFVWFLNTWNLLGFRL
jgi:hypothetical protein